MTINKATLDLICEAEGMVPHWYPDVARGWDLPTLGYGHTDAAGEPKYAKTKGKTFTEAECRAILHNDLAKFAATVDAAIKVRVTDNQFGACVSLAYNIGEGAFLRSTLLKRLNAADYAGAAEQFSRWNKAGGRVMAGLSRRRAAEKALFLSAAPSATTPAQPTKQPPTGLLGLLLGLFQFILKLFKRRS